MRVTKRAIPVEAVRFAGIEHGVPRFDEMPPWLRAALDKPQGADGAVWATEDLGLCVRTLEGVVRGSAGDYVMRGVVDELYIHRGGDTFARGYESAEEAAARAELVDLQSRELDEARDALRRALAGDVEGQVLAEVTPLAAGIRALALSERGHRRALEAALDRTDRLVVVVQVEGRDGVTMAAADRDTETVSRFAEKVATYYHLIVETARSLAAEADTSAVTEEQLETARAAYRAKAVWGDGVDKEGMRAALAAVLGLGRPLVADESIDTTPEGPQG